MWMEALNWAWQISRTASRMSSFDPVCQYAYVLSFDLWPCLNPTLCFFPVNTRHVFVCVCVCLWRCMCSLHCQIRSLLACIVKSILFCVEVPCILNLHSSGHSLVCGRACVIALVKPLTCAWRFSCALHFYNPVCGCVFASMQAWHRE